MRRGHARERERDREKRERERERGGEGTAHLCERPHKSAMGYST